MAFKAAVKEIQKSLSDELNREIIPAPDFPTAGIIHGISGVRDGYRDWPWKSYYARKNAC